MQYLSYVYKEPSGEVEIVLRKQVADIHPFQTLFWNMIL